MQANEPHWKRIRTACVPALLLPPLVVSSWVFCILCTLADVFSCICECTTTTPNNNNTTPPGGPASAFNTPLGDLHQHWTLPGGTCISIEHSRGGPASALNTTWGDLRQHWTCLFLFSAVSWSDSLRACEWACVRQVLSSTYCTVLSVLSSC